MEPSSSLYRVKEIRVQTAEKPPKEESHVIRWRGRNIIIRKGTSFSWWKEYTDATNDEIFSDLNKKSPIELLLKILHQSKKKT